MKLSPLDVRRSKLKISRAQQADNRLIRYIIISGGSGVFILGATGVATLSFGVNWGGHTTNTFVLNYRICNRLYQIINT